MTQNLEAVAAQFKQWRDSRNHRTHTPSKLANAAANLVGSYSKSKIIQRLGITNKALNRWITDSQGATEFVALNEQPSNASVASPLTLKLTLSKNAKLKLCADSDTLVNFLSTLQARELL